MLVLCLFCQKYDNKRTKTFIRYERVVFVMGTLLGGRLSVCMYTCVYSIITVSHGIQRIFLAVETYPKVVVLCAQHVWSLSQRKSRNVITAHQ